MNSKFSKNIEIEFNDSSKLIKDLNKPIVTVFGSARTKKDDKYYQESYNLTKKLSEKGCHILTGGGPGIMESANAGAFETKNSESIGFNIELPQEQKENSFLTKEFDFNHLFVRKPMLIFYSKIFVVFPGGFGTLDEFFEVLTLIQTKIMATKRVYLFGSKFYNPLIQFLRESLLSNNMIAEEDLNLFKIVDSIDEILDECNCE